MIASAITFLFVPGNRPDRFAKALASGADKTSMLATMLRSGVFMKDMAISQGQSGFDGGRTFFVAHEVPLPKVASKGW